MKKSCPCGYWLDSTHNCSCSPATVTRYQKRISGPLLDRFDIHIEVPRVEYEKLADSRSGESSQAIRARVNEVRAGQKTSFDGTFAFGDAVEEVGEGGVVWVAAGVSHGVENQGAQRLTLLVGIAPPP